MNSMILQKLRVNQVLFLTSLPVASNIVTSLQVPGCGLIHCLAAIGSCKRSTSRMVSWKKALQQKKTVFDKWIPKRTSNLNAIEARKA